MKLRLITFLAIGFCFISMVHAQTNEFPASENVGIGTTVSSALLHIRTGGDVSPFYPSSTSQGNTFSLAQTDNNAMEFGGVDDMSQYQGVAIGYPASSHLSLQVWLSVNGNVGIGTTNPQDQIAQ